MSYTFFQNPDSVHLTSPSYMALPELDLQRIRRYIYHWKRYAGISWEFQREDGSSLATYNFIRKFVDKHIYWLIGKGVNFTVQEPLSEIIGDFIDIVWRENNGDQLKQDMALMGGVTGDVFVLVTDRPHQQSFDSVFKKHGIHIQLLASETVFPRFFGSLTQTPEWYEVRTPHYNEKGEVQLFIQEIYQDRIVEYTDGYREATERTFPNPLGEFPIVHVPNIKMGTEYFGISDVEDILGLNDSFNNKATDLEDIIYYNASPLLLLFGAKLAEGERSPKSIWSGLPPEAKAQLIEMDNGTLNSSLDYLDMLYSNMLRIGDIPAGSLGDTQPISNTSGVALHTQYLPLIERAARKYPNYAALFKHINYLVLKWGELKGHIERDLSKLNICQYCGGKILETRESVNTAEFVTELPNPQVLEADNSFNQMLQLGNVPVYRDRCFEVDKKTLQVEDPNNRKVKMLTDIGFGVKLADLDKQELSSGKVNSFWLPNTDMEPLTEEDDVTTTSEVLRNLDFPEEPDYYEVVFRRDFTEEELKGNDVPPKAQKPVRGVVRSFITPKNCHHAEPLNPYETDVDFISVLPRDEHLQATLWQQYQTAGWTTPEEARENIPTLADLESKPQTVFQKLQIPEAEDVAEVEGEEGKKSSPTSDSGEGQMSSGKDLERLMTKPGGTNQ